MTRIIDAFGLLMPVQESVSEQMIAISLCDFLLWKRRLPAQARFEAMSVERIASQPNARLEPLLFETGCETMQVSAHLHAQPRSMSV